MSAYQFQVRTAIHAGENEARSTGALTAGKSRTKQAVIVSDRFLVQAGLTKPVEESMIESGFQVHVFDEVSSNPTLVEIDRIAKLIRSTGSDVVIGIGGGSPLDSAKTAALTAGADLPAAHYALGANPYPAKKVTVVGIPTTAGTGAEVTSTVIFSDSDHRKLWGWDERMAPEIAILDPLLTLGLPPHLTAATGMDAIVHAIEAAAGQAADPITRGIAMQSVSLVAKSLEQAVAVPDDVQARENLLLGAALAGIAIEHGGTGIAHNIGHALSSAAGLHHGQAVAIAMYHAYDFNLGSDRTEVFADVARALGVTGHFGDQRALAAEGGRVFREMIERLPISLQIDTEDPCAILEKLKASAFSGENEPMRNNNCRIPDDRELEALVELAAGR
ncbi:iron-containing alcohol dehydrogenase [Alteribacter natronophilus]|uniref:iron-containing alcohol dehydrogenase n=1 Tax=Alteribacter natronophilus TaxID=2583810 RepID=UPI00110DF450|nr:iron-containing alcohol dehydrogenase [Alteribacter natronophilus]TMW71261.1 iron-containing alcohol dehydrogenase [Alteribacter natronophilus]